MHTWQFQEAKAKLSEVVRLSKHEPQVITVHGKEEAVLISKEEFDDLKNKKTQPSLVELIKNSPFYGIDLDFSRDNSPDRDIKL